MLSNNSARSCLAIHRNVGMVEVTVVAAEVSHYPFIPVEVEGVVMIGADEKAAAAALEVLKVEVGGAVVVSVVLAT